MNRGIAYHHHHMAAFFMELIFQLLGNVIGCAANINGIKQTAADFCGKAVGNPIAR